MSPTEKKNKQELSLVISIVAIIGLILRLHRLSEDSFWNDEAGQVLAAIQPSIEGTIAVIKSHTMAMPLDYFVSRLFSQFGVSESILRLPSVLLGTGTILLNFWLMRKLSGHRTAIISSVFVAFSPELIRYSQEVRFYAALVFFYLTANLLLLNALQKNKSIHWFYFVVSTLIGVYFHPYVLLTSINGLLYLTLRSIKFGQNPDEWSPFILSLALISLISLPGLYYFSPSTRLEFELTAWSDAIMLDILRGLSFLASPYTNSTPLFGIIEFLVVVSFVSGITHLLRSRRNNYYQAYLLGSIIQIPVIILLDLLAGYWFSPRQLIHLVPASLGVAAYGIYGCIKYLEKHLIHKIGERRILNRLHEEILTISFCTVIVLSALPRIAQYYAYPKSNGRELSYNLLMNYSEGLPILIIPGYETKIYYLYSILLNESTSRLVTQALQPTTWEYLLNNGISLPNNAYLVTPFLLDRDQTKYLYEHNFTLIYDHETHWGNNRMLYFRNLDR